MVVHFKLLPLFFSRLDVIASFTVGGLFASIIVNINSAINRVHDIIKVTYNRLKLLTCRKQSNLLRKYLKKKEPL